MRSLACQEQRCEFKKISMSLAFGITKEVLIKLRHLLCMQDVYNGGEEGTTRTSRHGISSGSLDCFNIGYCNSSSSFSGHNRHHLQNCHLRQKNAA
jgi:hypothetical protein